MIKEASQIGLKGVATPSIPSPRLIDCTANQFHPRGITLDPYAERIEEFLRSS
jgi:hypothetical protein